MDRKKVINKKNMKKFLVGVIIFLGLFMEARASNNKIFQREIKLPVFSNSFNLKIDDIDGYNAFVIEGVSDKDMFFEFADEVYRLPYDEDHKDRTELIVTDRIYDEFSLNVYGDNQSELNIKIYFFNTLIDTSLEKNDLVAGSIQNGLRIVSRKGWGVDESLMYTDEPEDIEDRFAIDETKTSAKEELCRGVIDKYPFEFDYKHVDTRDDNNQYYIWPLQYSNDIKKIVIHHTAAAHDENRNPKNIMRAIYYYHTVSRGWGDIGYNYVIDRNGTIYEGRKGGDYVVGGHVYCNNIGTIGVSLMGNFVDENPSKEQITALIKLLAVLTKKYGVDPIGKEVFHGKITQNILGHKDLAATACPGENLYNKLFYIRQNVAYGGSYKNKDLKGASELYAGEIVTNLKVFDIDPTTTKKIVYKIKNVGKKTWDKDTWLFIDNNNKDARTKNVIDGKDYVASVMKESKVKPGDTATFEVDVMSGYKDGFYTFEFIPVINGKYRLDKTSILQPFSVKAAVFDYEFVSISDKLPDAVLTNEQFRFFIDIRNTGNVTWYNDQGDWNEITLGTSKPQDRESAFKVNHKERLGFLRDKEVRPGEIGRFYFNLKSPSIAGDYTEYFTPVIDQIRWLQDKNMHFSVKVGNPNFRFRIPYLKQKNIQITANTIKEIKLSFKNISNFVWEKEKIKFKVSKLSDGIDILDPDTEKKITEIEIDENVGAQDIIDIYFKIKVKKDAEPLNQIKVTPNYGGIEVYSVPMWVHVAKKDYNNESTIYDSGDKNKAEQIRVKLSFDMDSVVIGGDGYFDVTDLEGNPIFDNVKKDVKVTLQDIAKQNTVTGMRFIPQKDTILEIKNWDHQPAWSDKINDNKYRGILEIRTDLDVVLLINELPLEDYLKGVAEVSNTEHPEKQKVIAILARTYARYYLDKRKFPGKPYDASDDPDIFQKYLGYNYELRSPNFVKNVVLTKDLVVTYNKKLVKTPYFNQSDGHTRSAKEVWGWEDTPYLVSKEDPYCDNMELKGHGVGLSGYGAYQAAVHGKTYEEIIKYYFEGVAVEDLNL